MSGVENNPRNSIGEYKSEGDNSIHVGINEGQISQTNATNIAKFTVGSRYKDELPGLYSRALQEFENQVNEYLKKIKPTDIRTPQVINNEIKELQHSTNEVAEEASSSAINKQNKPDANEKATIWEKIKKVGTRLAKFLPEGITIGMAMTPLAPFAGLAGKAAEEFVKEL
jgi:hypothetical protein